MRYFKGTNGREWRLDGDRVEQREWEPSNYRIFHELMMTNEIAETDAAGNPLGKYRYFRDTKCPAPIWRVNEGREWCFKGVSEDNESWDETNFDSIESFMRAPTSYECDESGNRLEAKGVTFTNCTSFGCGEPPVPPLPEGVSPQIKAKGFTLPEGTKIIPCGSPEAVAADNATPSPAPMSEEERFRWQFAGQAMQGIISTSDQHRYAKGSISEEAVWMADNLIAALEKPKATENGGGK